MPSKLRISYMCASSLLFRLPSTVTFFRLTHQSLLFYFIKYNDPRLSETLILRERGRDVARLSDFASWRDSWLFISPFICQPFLSYRRWLSIVSLYRVESVITDKKSATAIFRISGRRPMRYYSPLGWGRRAWKLNLLPVVDVIWVDQKDCIRGGIRKYRS